MMTFVNDRKSNIVMCRISTEAREKLIVLAKERHYVQSTLLSRIVIHYSKNKVDVDSPYPEDLRGFKRALDGLNLTLSKVAGSTERTENFIKTLLLDDRELNSNLVNRTEARPSDDERDNIAEKPEMRQALVILKRLLDAASATTDYAAKPIMQIRIPVAEFNQIKTEYDELCTLQNM